jgi:hypothetical protein
MTTTFQPPTWTVPPDAPPEPPSAAPRVGFVDSLRALPFAAQLAIVALVVAVAATLTYNWGHDRGERDAIQHCQDATPGIVSGIGRLVGPSGSRLVVCTVPRG